MEYKKFFLPYADSEEQAERVYSSIKEFLNTVIGCRHTDDRIYQIKYTHNGVSYTDTVGEPASLEPTQNVIAIFRGANVSYICTRNRGVENGYPIMCRPDSIIYFAEQEE